ncbi:LysR family transcriptional regulator [sulfur-oxidizing endosymbiont of Gigantopelta aegis]|uniref:LysR family transcriptional regulator n=1 Tax=sulfur-oxidizing endosymbiont of Gigantopelta aegis TaxID=2794934 RepID=UPI0018DBCE5B|nr:LysR family transcriptional regulator [sulfur-oxidizing endosymbiont of Gigantopelta aegis]
MLDDLKRMVIFTHVVDTGSFSGAAKRLGVAKSAISKHISLLEQSTGIRLLNRNTRSLSLTDIGEGYYQSCIKLVEVVEEAQGRISSAQEEPRGNLKISSPSSFGIDHVSPLLHQFLQQYPLLNAELLLDDNMIDMTEAGIDVAIRIGWLPDSNLRAKKIKDSPRLLCASPEYLKGKKIPTSPADLTQLEWIIFTLLPTPYQYELLKKNQAKAQNKTIHIKGRIKTNNASAVRRLMLEGAGIAALSDFLIEDDLNKGNLVQLLPDYKLSDVGIYAVYQNQHLQQAKIRTFINYVVDKL